MLKQTLKIKIMGDSFKNGVVVPSFGDFTVRFNASLSYRQKHSSKIIKEGCAS